MNRIGIYNTQHLYPSLINDNSSFIDWIKNNTNIVLNKMIHKLDKEPFIYIYQIGNKRKKNKSIYIIYINELYGEGTWGKTYPAYIFNHKYYTNDKFINMAINNKKMKLKGYINMNIKTYSKAFYLLLKNDIHFVRFIISKSTKYIVKISNSFIDYNDAIQSKDTLYDSIIHSIISCDKTVHNYIPLLKYIFLGGSKNNYKLFSIMEKMDDSIETILNKGKKMNTDFILSYLLQISIGLYDLYKINFNHRDLKLDNTMYLYKREDISKTIHYKQNITINNTLLDIEFDFPSFGYTHKLIDFGLSCIIYKQYNLFSETFYTKNTQLNRGRDLTFLVFSILNYYWDILHNNLKNYLSYLLEITSNCSLVVDLINNTKTHSYHIDTMNHFETQCNEINDLNEDLYNLLDNIDFDNKKTYPEQIIYDIYNYKLTHQLPQKILLPQ